MRHLLKVVLLLAAFCMQAMGQISDPASIEFALVNRELESDNRLVLLTPWYAMYGDIKGNSTLSASPDITADSMEILTDYHERYWTMTIKSWDSPLLRLGLREFGFGAVREEFTDSFTLTNLGGGAFWTDSLFKNVSGHTFDWSVCFNDTSEIDVGDEFRFYFWKTRFIQGSDLGALGTFSLPHADTLTILAWDTLKTTADTIWTTAILGDVGYVSLFIDQYPNISTGISMFGVGIQTKIDNGPWAFPLDNNRSIVDVMIDSAAVDSGVVVERLNNVPADSVRFALWSKSAWDVIIRKVQALWRD